MPYPLINFLLIVKPEFWIENFFNDLVDMSVRVFDPIHFFEYVQLFGLVCDIDVLSFFFEFFLGEGSIFELFLSPLDQHFMSAFHEEVKGCSEHCISL